MCQSGVSNSTSGDFGLGFVYCSLRMNICCQNLASVHVIYFQFVFCSGHIDGCLI